jgi:hypothetical protein
VRRLDLFIPKRRVGMNRKERDGEARGKLALASETGVRPAVNERPLFRSGAKPPPTTWVDVRSISHEKLETEH